MNVLLYFIAGVILSNVTYFVWGLVWKRPEESRYNDKRLNYDIFRWISTVLTFLLWPITLPAFVIISGSIKLQKYLHKKFIDKK